jgi:alpha-L-arabinofuranosidase
VNLYEVNSDNHALYDGVFFAGCLNKMIQRAGRVMGAHLAFFLNTFGVIQTVGDRHFVTAAYLVHQLYRKSCRCAQAPVTVQSQSMLVPALEGADKAVFVRDISRVDRQAAILDSAATVDESGTTVYLTNRSISESITVALSGITPASVDARFRYVTAESPYSRNTVDCPNAIRIAELPVAVRDGRAEVIVPPCTAGALLAGPIAGALAAP